MNFDKALESIKAIKLTGGIFGKTTLLLMVLCICVAAVSIQIGTWWFALLVMLPVIGLAYYTLKRCFDFAEQYPQAAIMDGAELLVHERIIHEKKGDVIVPIQGATIDHPQPSLEVDEIHTDDLPPIATNDAPNPNDEGAE